MTANRVERHRRGRRRRNKRNKGKLEQYILIAVLSIIVGGVFLIGWTGVRFIMEFRIDPDDPVDGIDISSYQTDINWYEVEEEGYEFAVIKATEGSSHVDPRFAINWKQASETGMSIGAYHFLSFDTDGDTQAENFIENVDKKWGSLPPTIDIELYGDYVNSPPDKETVDGILTQVIHDFEDAYGKKPILYTNPHVYGLYLEEDEQYEDYPIWISDPEVPDQLPDGREWTFCQYSFEGESDAVGEGEHVDLNLFNGSLWKLKHLK